WNVSLHNRLDRAREALRGVPLTGAKGSVVVSNGSGALVVSDLGPAPAGKTYEAWVIKGGRASPAGTFAGGGRTLGPPLTRPPPAGGRGAAPPPPSRPGAPAPPQTAHPPPARL